MQYNIGDGRLSDWQNRKDLDLLNWILRDYEKVYSNEQGLLSLQQVLETKLDESDPVIINKVDSSELFNLVYPVGSVYMSVSDVDPSVLFGGTWERIEDTFLLSSGSTYSATYDSNGFADNTGGEASHTLTVDEMPEHNHRADINLRYLNNSATASESSFVSDYSNKYKTQISNSSIDVGGGDAHNNMPPYLVVNVWKRVE